MRSVLSFRIFAITVAVIISGCSLDNYDEPSSHLTGSVSFNGNPIGLCHGKVSFHLYQEGYGKNGPIPVYLSQDGRFSALLYNGTYRIEAIDNNGPWENNIEPVDLEVAGDVNIEIPVSPYYVLSDVSIVLNGSEVRSVCNVSEVSAGKEARQLFLCIGTTRFISDQSYSYVGRKNKMPVTIGGNGINMDISDIMEEYDILYARLGLQMNGLQECIYSEVVRIK